MHLPPFKLERYFAKYEFNTEYLLCSSDCEAMSIADLLALEPGSAEKFQNVWLGYTESQGSPSLRREIANLYTTIQPEDVLVHTGAGEAIYLFMYAAFKKGDHVIVHSPGYQSLAEVARAVGCDVSPWRAREQDGWVLDLDELRHLMRTNTKGIIINTPPTLSPIRIAELHIAADPTRGKEAWPGIGYHFIVQADGTIEQTNPLEISSFHVFRHYPQSVGVCFAGSFMNGKIPTSVQLRAGAHLIAWLMQELNVPLARVWGHRDFPENVTVCPPSSRRGVATVSLNRL